jgi:hypothetical protein
MSRFPLCDDLPVKVKLVEKVSERGLKLVTHHYRSQQVNEKAQNLEAEQAAKRAKQDSTMQRLLDTFYAEDQDGFSSIGGDILSRVRYYTRTPGKARFYDESQSIPSSLRDWLFKYSSHLDCVNCHYSLVVGFGKRYIDQFEDTYPRIVEYWENRETVIGQLHETLEHRVSTSVIKRVFLAALNGQGEKASKVALGLLTTDSCPLVVKELIGEVRALVNYLWEEEDYRAAYPECVAPFAAFQTFLFTLESRHMITLFEIMKNECEPTLWVHDGVEVMGQFEGDDTSCELLQCLRPSLREAGFYDEVCLKFKDKSESITQYEEMFLGQALNEENEHAYTELNKPELYLYDDFPCDDYELAKKYMDGRFKLFRTMDPDLVYYYVEKQWRSKTHKKFNETFSHLIIHTVVTLPSSGNKPAVEKIVDKPFTQLWLEDRNVPSYYRASFYPDPRMCPAGVKNLYTGPDICEVELTPADTNNPYYLAELEFLLSHIMFLCDGDEHVFAFLLMFLGHMFQHPTVTPRLMIILYSQVQGTGKSSLLNILCKMIGSNAAVTSDLNQVFGSFNSLLEGKLMLGLDECKITKANDCRLLKSYLTVNELPINRKGIDAQVQPNRMRIIGTTNDSFPIKLPEEEEERRTFIVTCSGSMLDSVRAVRLSNVVHRPKILRHFYDYLMKVPVSANYDFAKHRPKSKLYDEIRIESRSPEVASLMQSLRTIIEEKKSEEERVAMFDISPVRLYREFRAFMEFNYPGNQNYQITAPQFQKKCREFLGITRRGNEWVHGVKHRCSHGEEYYSFNLANFETWFKTKVE